MKKLPLFLALDVDTKEQALSLVKKTAPYVLGYKIGPRLLLQYGRSLIDEIKKHDTPQIFIDFKFYDIPSSTVEAVRSLYNIGADCVTVHASVGGQTLKLLSDLEKELNQTREFKILCVTVLSSVEDPKAEERVGSLADLVNLSGLNGLVCSPLEVQKLRIKYPDMYLVTPGIRLSGDDRGDQKRVTTPEQALKSGSSALVMGRSLTKAKDSVEILKNMQKALLP